jgi:hypothetical protein
MTSNVVGLFDDMYHAQSAVADLEREGVPESDISVMANEAVSQSVEPAVPIANDSPLAAAGTGAAVGGAAGLALGLVAMTGPGIGPVVAAGPIFAALSGALMGAAAGGIIGALVDAGVPELEAGYYAEGVRRGGIVVTATVAPSFVGRATEIMRGNGAVDIHDRVSFWRETGWKGFNPNAPAFTRDEIERERAALSGAPGMVSEPPTGRAAKRAIESEPADEVARRRAA